MEREIFNLIGETLYGMSWFSPMAGYLDIPQLSIYEFSTGVKPVPESVRNELYKALKERGNTISMLIRELED
jgi:hypothetical protein